jgi:hypothetical protein
MYLSGLIAGALLLSLVFHDAFEVMLLPRRIRRKLRPPTNSALLS